MPWTLSAFADESGEPLDQQILALQRAGIEYVDVRKVNGYAVTELPLDEAAHIRERLNDAGIAVLMYGSPIGKIDIHDDFQIDLTRLEHLGRLRDVLGAHAVRIFSYYNRDEVSGDEWCKESVARLYRLRETAEKLDLVLYHENEKGIFGEHRPRIQILAEQLRDDRFKLIFDFDNYQQGNADVWDNWQQLKHVTDAFHLKDSDEQHMHVPVGQGRGRVREILTDAWRMGWEGPLSIEPHLTRSAAVMATGPHGKSNQAFADMSLADSFHAAATVAIDLLKDVQASTR